MTPSGTGSTYTLTSISTNKPNTTSTNSPESVESSGSSSSNKGGIIAGVVVGVCVLLSLILLAGLKFWKPKGMLKERFESSREF